MARVRGYSADALETGLYTFGAGEGLLYGCNRQNYPPGGPGAGAFPTVIRVGGGRFPRFVWIDNSRVPRWGNLPYVAP